MKEFLGKRNCYSRVEILSANDFSKKVQEEHVQAPM